MLEKKCIFAAEIIVIMEQEVGISLCTGGWAKRIVGSRMCHVEKGFITVLTPMIPAMDAERSEDYGECVVVEDMGRVSGETAPFFSKIIPLVSNSIPCIKLDEDKQEYIVNAVRHIAERESLQPETEIFRQMNDHLIALQRLQLILEFLYEFASTERPEVDTPSRDEQLFVDFMRSLTLHYADRFNVADYAAEACLTVRHFSSLIQQYSGQTPKQWIHTFTINQAKHLLMQPGMQVKEVADRLGFPEQFTFRKYFKTHTGLSPTDYREGKNTRQ